MPPQETGKQRAARIPLDYFKHPNRLERWKKGLLLGALAVSVVWSLSGFLPGDLKYSRGDVASVHATWENNCNACHTDFKPIGGGSSTARLVGLDPHAGSQKCQTCHQGPAHHLNEDKAETPECASCHREHRGRMPSLIRGFDSDCTQCHADLAKHLPAESKGHDKIDVTRFDLEHPEFSSIKKDPGKLKFNHALHLLPGMGLGKKLDYITDPNYRKRYGDAQGAQAEQNSEIRLTCASCHQTDSADFKTAGQLVDVPAAVLSARSSGAYMQPITYENQCRACHPISLPTGSKDKTLTIPHRLQPKEVHAFIERTVIGELLDPTMGPKLTEWLQTPRPFPGRGPNEEQKEKARALREVMEERVKILADKMPWMGKQTCGECHHYEMQKDNPLVPARVLSPEVPSVWFKHARFDHKAHRAVDCLQCHKDVDKSTTAENVLIPGRETCLKCHAPVETNAKGEQVGGARFDCAECHRYHQGFEKQGVDWLQGLGAKARARQNMVDIKTFLSGK